MKRIDFFVSEQRDRPTLHSHPQGRGSGVFRETCHRLGAGRGDFGANAHVVVFCEEPLLDALRSHVDPLLKRFGGVGFVSDAEIF